MYAVRINPDSACKPKLRAPGEVWVSDKTSNRYVHAHESALFDTVQRANEHIKHAWEMVVKVEVEK